MERDFTAAVANTGTSGTTPAGTVTFQDIVYFVPSAGVVQSAFFLANAALSREKTRSREKCAEAPFAQSAGVHFLRCLALGFYGSEADIAAAFLIDFPVFGASARLLHAHEKDFWNALAQN